MLSYDPEAEFVIFYPHIPLNSSSFDGNGSSGLSHGFVAAHHANSILHMSGEIPIATKLV